MIDWKTSPNLVSYEDSIALMERRVADIYAGQADELVWLLEHPPLYTFGTSAKSTDLLDAERFPIYEAGRGGEYTYHGPGQRIAYTMLNLNERGKDLRAYVQQLEQWIILTLAEFGIKGFTREGRIGVWVETQTCTLVGDPLQARQGQALKTEKKIAALGIRVRKWVTFHGIALNVNPDLSHFGGIVPCGISNYGVTSLHDMGVDVSMEDVDSALIDCFNRIF